MFRTIAWNFQVRQFCLCWVALWVGLVSSSSMAAPVCSTTSLDQMYDQLQQGMTLAQVTTLFGASGFESIRQVGSVKYGFFGKFAASNDPNGSGRVSVLADFASSASNSSIDRKSSSWYTYNSAITARYPATVFDAIAGSTTLAQLQSTIGSPGTEMSRGFGPDSLTSRVWRFSDGTITTSWSGAALYNKTANLKTADGTFTATMVNQIAVGMTRDQVSALLGAEPNNLSQGFNTLNGAAFLASASWYSSVLSQGIRVDLDGAGRVSVKPSVPTNVGTTLLNVADIDVVYQAVTPGMSYVTASAALASYAQLPTVAAQSVNLLSTQGSVNLNFSNGNLSSVTRFYNLDCSTPSPTQTLNVVVSGNGSVTAPSISCGTNCSVTYATGTLVTLTATPASFNRFTGWSGACTGTQTCSMTMDATKSVTATFASTLVPNAIDISGPNTLQSAGKTTLAVTARYSDNTKRTVFPTWASSNPAVASVSTTGILSAGSVTVDTPVTLTASYTDNGVTVNATLQVMITAAPAVLSSLRLTDVGTVQSGGQVRLTVSAHYADGSDRTVFATSYTLSNTALGSVNLSRSLLTVSAVTTDTPLTLTVTYVEGSITKTASLTITISAAPVVLSRLTLIGAQSTLASGQSLNLTAQGVYADGSRKTVLANWQVSGNDATITSSGVLTAKTVSQDVTSVVSATFTESGVTVSAQYLVVIQAAAVLVTPVQAEVEATGIRTDFGLSIWTALRPISAALANMDVSAPRGGLQPAGTGSPTYKMFVVAIVPAGGFFSSQTILLLNRNREWQAVSSPLAEYLSGVSENSDQLVELFEHLDANVIAGTKFYIGYGLTDVEMLEKERFRMVAQLQ